MLKYLKEFYRAGGSDEGLDTSVNAMDPLDGLNEDEEIRFMRWLNIDERKMLNNAYKFFEHIKAIL